MHRGPETRTGETWMTTLFHSDTVSVSQPNGLMCVHDDARQSTMCKCPEDDDYQTSSECPSNSHYSHDFSHASSMRGERNRRTATRERTYRSSRFPASRVTNRAKPARDAVLSPWMCPPSGAQRLVDVCLPVFSSCVTSQVHISFTNNGHHLRTLYHVYETCCCHQLQALLAVSTID